MRHSLFPFPFSVKGSCSGDRMTLSVHPPLHVITWNPTLIHCRIPLSDEIERCDCYSLPRILGHQRLSRFCGIISIRNVIYCTHAYVYLCFQKNWSITYIYIRFCPSSINTTRHLTDINTTRRLD